MNSKSEFKKSEETLTKLILDRKICGVCNCNSFFGKAYNVRISGNRTLKVHAYCLDKLNGFPETIAFLEKKLHNIFYFNLNKDQPGVANPPLPSASSPSKNQGGSK